MNLLICVIMALASIRKIMAGAEPSSAEAAAFAQASGHNQGQRGHQQVFDTSNDYYQARHRSAPQYYQNSEYGGETSTSYAVPGSIARHKSYKHPRRAPIHEYQGFEQGDSSNAYAQAFAQAGADSNREGDFRFPIEDHVANIQQIASQNQLATNLYRYPDQRDSGSQEIYEYVQNEGVPNAYNLPSQGHVAQTLYARRLGNTGSRDTDFKELHDYAQSEGISDVYNFPDQGNIAQLQYARRHGDTGHRVFRFPEQDETATAQAFAGSNADSFPIKTYTPTNVYHIPGQDAGQSEIVQDAFPPAQSESLSNRRIIHVPVHSDAVKVKVIHVPDLSDTSNILKIIEQSRLVPSQLLPPASNDVQPVYTESVSPGNFSSITAVQPSYTSSIIPDQQGDLASIIAAQPTHSLSVIPVQPNESSPVITAQLSHSSSVIPDQLGDLPSVIGPQPSFPSSVLAAQLNESSPVVAAHPDDSSPLISAQLNGLPSVISPQPSYPSSVIPPQPNEYSPVVAAHPDDSSPVISAQLTGLPSVISPRPSQPSSGIPAQPDESSPVVAAHPNDFTPVISAQLAGLPSVISLQPSQPSLVILPQPNESSPVVAAHSDDSAPVISAQLTGLPTLISPQPSQPSSAVPAQLNESSPVVTANLGESSLVVSAQLSDVIANEPCGSSSRDNSQSSDSSSVNTQSSDSSSINTDKQCETCSDTALSIDDFAQSTDSSETRSGEIGDILQLDTEQTSDTTLLLSDTTDFSLSTADQSIDTLAEDASNITDYQVQTADSVDTSLFIPDTNNVPISEDPLFGSPTSNTIGLPDLLQPLDLLLNLAHRWYQGHIGKYIGQPTANNVVQSDILPFPPSDVSDDNCTMTLDPTVL